MKITIIGGDGFCGWPTVLRFLAEGHEVQIIDNLSRRAIDEELNSNSLSNIASIEQRVITANRVFSTECVFHKFNVATQYDALKQVLSEWKPDTIIHFGEQRSAPYSMISEKQRRYTVDNNIAGTHNLLNCITEIDRDIHFIHLGTMGVYGYSKEFGRIPEGYLDVTINDTQESSSILYPANPGSVYHMTKCLDQLLFQFYSKNWGIAITDLHQGIVWGFETKETQLSPDFVNRYDYDGIYGTVLNRFITQAAIGEKLSVYGTGGQARAFINITDTAECIKLAAYNPAQRNSRPRVFNQVAEVKKVIELAQLVSDFFGVDIEFLPNPRKELSENELEVANIGLKSLGYEPVLMKDELIFDAKSLVDKCRQNFRIINKNNSPLW